MKPSVAKPAPRSIPLAHWIVRSYLRTAILPLFLIEVTFLAIYWLSSNFIYDRNATAIAHISKDYMADLARREGDIITQSLGRVEDLTSLMARQTRLALATPYRPSATERARYGFAKGGAFVTLHGTDQSASFYSGLHPIGPAERDKVWRMAQIDPLMRDIKAANPMIAQLYFNSHDSYNRIYPYFDTWRQYPARMDIPAYNFYYEADARHNPARRTVWTDAYVDPAGGGWMVSSIAPVYADRRLEGVVGIDITIKTLIRHVLDMDIPWNGYALLIGRDGTILAIPPAGERDFSVKELKNHQYTEAVKADIFKPESYNIKHRTDLAPLARTLWSPRDDSAEIKLAGRDMIVTHSHIHGPNWTLVILAPVSEILADATALRNRLHRIGMIMALALLGFYILFLVFLMFRTRALSRRLADPLHEIGAVIAEIGAGRYEQVAPVCGVTEIDSVSHSLVDMGSSLSRAYATILEQERRLSAALERTRRITAEQHRFIEVISHELRTPLTMIDSTGQILQRRADRLTPDTLRERGHILRRAVQRCNEALTSALQLLKLGTSGTPAAPSIAKVDVADIVNPVAEALRRTHPKIQLNISSLPPLSLEVDPEMIRVALAAIADNAAKYCGAQGVVDISVRQDDDGYAILVHDNGPGISEEDLPLIRDRFYRGSNNTGISGAGVGLFLADQLIRANGGQLDIDRAEEGGTLVTLHLPHPPIIPEAQTDGVMPSPRTEDAQSLGNNT